MKSLTKPNVSPLEAELENKINMGYLFSVASKNHVLHLSKLFEAHCTDASIQNTKQTNQLINNKTEKNENN